MPPRLLFGIETTYVGKYLNEGDIYQINIIDSIEIKIGNCINYTTNTNKNKDEVLLYS